MGTSSLSPELIELLTPWTSKIPIVLVSRSVVGWNYDDDYYKGSVQKYESRGFILRGYEELNAIQARTKLIFELSSKNSGIKTFV